MSTCFFSKNIFFESLSVILLFSHWPSQSNISQRRNNMIYIICEKNSLANNIYDILSKNGIKDICCFSAISPFIWSDQTDGYGPYWVNIPKNMTFKDIPYYKKPELVLKKKYNSRLINEKGIIKDCLDIDFNNNEVVYLDDEKGTNLSFVFTLFCKYKGIPKNVSFMRLFSLVEKDILTSFQMRKPFNINDTNYMLSYTNNMYDASFFLNSMVLFESFKIQNSLKLAKEHIYCLFAVKKGEFTYNNSLNNIHDDLLITGTGKYPPCSLPIIYNYTIYNNIVQKQGFINSIIQDLASCGLLSININDNSTELTEQGEFFLNSLHPDCYDPDIFGRIIEWSKLSLDEIDVKISQYIKRYFGKQKRFQSSQYHIGKI